MNLETDLAELARAERAAAIQSAALRRIVLRLALGLI